MAGRWGDGDGGVRVARQAEVLAELGEEQRAVAEAVLAGGNVFITGAGGVGWDVSKRGSKDHLSKRSKQPISSKFLLRRVL